MISNCHLTLQAKEILYVIKADNTIWVITFATGMDEFDRRLPLFEQSARTLTLPLPDGKSLNLASILDETIGVPTATPVAPSDWPVVLFDTFDSNVHDWPTGSDRDEFATTKYGFTDGKYRWEVKAHQDVNWRVYLDVKAVSDFYLTTEIQQISGPNDSSYGVVFRWTSADDFYYFGLSNTQEFIFLRLYQDEWTTLIDWTPAAVIRPGQVNRVTAIAEGPYFTFLINDQWVAETDDDILAKGKVGLTIELSNAGDEAVFEFDNFELRAPAMPRPTKTPPQTAASLPDAVVKIETLNVRTGPGTEYDIIAGAHRGNELEVIGQAGYGCEWLKVSTAEGTVGWVSGQAEYVTLNLSCSQIPVMLVPPTPTPSASDFEVPPGKALFVFYNYTNIDWNVDIGPYFLAVPANKPGQEYAVVTIVIDPGKYTLQGHSADADFYITDDHGHRAFEFTVAAGEIYEESVR